MRTHVRRNLNRIVGFTLMVLALFSLAACGNGQSSDPTPSPGSKFESAPPAASDSNAANTAIPLPDGFDLDDEPDAMFAIVWGNPAEMGEPAKIIDSHFPEETESNYAFCLIPLRDGLHISIENIYNYDLFFSEPPYERRSEFTAALGAYYLVNAFKDSEPYAYTCVRIVAQDGTNQASFLLDPTIHGEGDEFIISPAKIHDRLNDSQMRLLSGMAAGTVWQYGKELGWVDSLGLSEAAITPQQLALSQSACQQALENLMIMINYDYRDRMPLSEKTAVYAAALFPDIQIDELPETDAITNDNHLFLTWLPTAEIILTAPSADGKAGYVIVCISYANENGAFDDFYRVDWAADGPLDVYRPFCYKLIGVQPLERFLLGGRPFEQFMEKHLGAESAADLQALGIAYGPWHLDTPGAWGTGNTILLRAIGLAENEGAIAYVLVDDNEDRVVYLGAASHTPIELEIVEEQDGIDWNDLGIVHIPSNWTYEIHILDDIVINGENTSGPIDLWAGWLMSDSIESELARCNSYEPFTFNDGQTGYMLFFDSYISWIREDWMSLNLSHNGDETIYSNSNDLLLKIARSLTVK